MNVKIPNVKYSSGKPTALKKKGLCKGICCTFTMAMKIDSNSGKIGMRIE